MTRPEIPEVGGDRGTWGPKLVSVLDDLRARTEEDYLAEIGSGIESVSADPSPTLGGDLDLDGHAIPGVTDAVAHLAGNHTLAAYDAFAAHANGSISGVTPAIGPNWGVSGTAPTVSSGVLTGTGGYAYLTLDDPPHYIEATGTFGATGTANTLAWADTPFGLDNLIHLIYNSSTFTLTVRQDEGSFIELLAGHWRTSCKLDNATPYRVGIGINGMTAVIFGPNGETFSVMDPRLLTLSQTDTVFWQPNNDYEIASIRAVRYPVATAAAELLSMLDMAAVGLIYGPENQIAGNLNNWHQVMIGQGPSNGLPSVVFGPATVITKLTADVSIGASSISTERPIYGATTVVINGGDDAETVTLSGAPSPLPGAASPPTSHAQGISGTTSKAHPAGTVVKATGFTRATIYQHPFVAGNMLVAGGPFVIDGVLYLTSNFDTSLSRSAAGVIETTSQIKATGALTTKVKAGAPDDTDITSDSDGTMILDTTNHRLYVRDGGTWRYATLT